MRDKFNLIIAEHIEPKMEASRYMDREENENELKLFMSHADCAAEVANDDACATENGCEILPFPLSSVVQDSGSAAFKFAAPSSSLQHTESYLGKGVYFRKVDDDEE